MSGVQREIVIIEQLVLGSNAIQYPIRSRGFLETFDIAGRRDNSCVHMVAIVNVSLEVIFRTARGPYNAPRRKRSRRKSLITFSLIEYFTNFKTSDFLNLLQCTISYLSFHVKNNRINKDYKCFC